MATVTGTNGNDALVGTADDDEIYGLGGNDTLDGGGGFNVLFGGAGHDFYYVRSFSDFVVESPGEGYDTVLSFLSSYSLPQDVEALVLHEAAGAAMASGNGGDNLLIGNRFDNWIDGSAGADRMLGGRGNDTYYVDSAGDHVVEGSNEGTDVVHSSVSFTLGANVESLTLTGGDPISATGNALNNVLQGNAALNTLTGGGGNDTYVIERGAPINPVSSFSLAGEPDSLFPGTLTFGPTDGFFFSSAGSAGPSGQADSMSLAFTTLDFGSSFNVGVSTHQVGLTLEPGFYGDTRFNQPDHPGLLVQGNPIGSASEVYGAFTIHDVEFDYTFGVPTLVSIWIDFEQRADSPVAPAFTGTYKYNYTDQYESDTIVELANQGIDTVRSNFSYTLGANLENLVLTGNATRGTGNALANVITGNERGNTLDGGAGADSMAGGAGNDTYVVDNRHDSVSENAGAGTDLVRSSVTYTLSANVENLTLTGAGAIDGTGDALANVITGNGAANRLRGGDGNDTLDGGAGADRMEGDRGNDTYVVDNSGDDVRENPGQGTDTVRSSIDYTLGAHVENLTLTGGAALNGTGNALDNVIVGNGAANTLTGDDGNDTLDGQGGADTMRGGRGNDTYHVDQTGDVVSEAGGGGIDTVFSAVTFTLGADFENLTLTGFNAINGTGNARNNILIGNAVANTLTAGDGDDLVDGGGGIDTLRGGAGNDIYGVDDTADAVVEAANQGTDLVRSSATFTLSVNVEDLTLTGVGNVDGTGNALANVINGNAGNNLLDGRAGADRMSGGAGNDAYVVERTGDVVVENANQGIDTVQSSITYTLGANLENLALTGLSAINGTGNGLNNVLAGNSAANVLRGLAGNDTYVIGAGDTVIENANEGTDTVISSVTHTLGTNFENLVLSGTANVNGTGNARNNVLIGNSGNNALSGDDGNDRLDGGLGVDTLRGGAGNDTYVVNDGDLSAAGTRMSLQGAPGAYIVEDTRLLAGPDYAVTIFTDDATRDGAVDQVYVQFSSTTMSDYATVTVNSFALGENLRPGTYLDARAAQAPGAGHPGLDLTANGRGGFISWNFQVNELLVDYGSASFGPPAVLRLSLDFEAHLHDIPGSPPMTGAVRYNASSGGVTGDSVVELANQGTDTVESSIEYRLTDHVENLVLTGTGSIRGTGNALANAITGNGGDNFIDGLGGADTLRGGAGNDVYVIDNAGDVVAENADEGLDRVISSVTHTLGAHFENLILTGSAAINGTGNGLDNGLSGNAGANVLTGGAGNDTYVIDGLDTVVENADGGFDTVRSFASHTLGNHVEGLVLMGTADLNGTGNALDNTINGNSGDNVLTGGAGFDFIRGGRGDDVYVLEDFDVVLEEFDSGTDLVLSAIGYSLMPDVENLTLTGTADISGGGNDLANVITGNSGNNTLDGGRGLDTLTGGEGDDTYIVDATVTNTTATLSLDGGPGSLFPDMRVITEADGSLVVNGEERTGDGRADTVHVGYSGDTGPGGAFEVLNLTFTTQRIAGVNLEPGTYANAERAFSESDGAPGIFFAGFPFPTRVPEGALFGEFTVNGSAFDYSEGFPRVLQFSADFEIRDGAPDADVLLGSIDYEATLTPDAVVEQANAGTDTVVASISYTLGDNVENLRLAGIAPLDGAGNALDNQIVGNFQSNRLTGGGGSDLFLYDTNSATDRITDFVRGSAGDVLDISDVLNYFDSSSNVADYVQLTANGSHTDVRVDYDGTMTGYPDFATLVTLENVTWSAGLLNEMLAQGNLVVA